MMVCALVVGCGGGDDAAPTTPPGTTGAPTTAAPPVTSAPSTSAAPATTTSTTGPTTPPTTVSPTTATPPPTPAADLRAEIEADLNEGEQAYIAAGADPGSPESQAVLTKYFSGASLDAVRKIFQRLVDEGFSVTPNPNVPNVVRLLAEPSPVQGSSTTMLIDVCRIDAGIVVAKSSTPGGPQVTINDDIVKETSRSTVELVGDTWTLTDGDELAPDEPGVTTCG